MNVNEYYLLLNVNAYILAMSYIRYDPLMNARELRRRGVAVLLILAAVTLIASQSAAVFASTNYGDTDIEPITSTLMQQYVVALTKITVSHPTVMQSVSLYMRYTGSDGSQCIKFGIYADNGNGSPCGQKLVAATQNGYCFQVTETYGPAWETWQLAPSDYLTISTPGVYWLCTLANQAIRYDLPL